MVRSVRLDQINGRRWSDCRSSLRLMITRRAVLCPIFVGVVVERVHSRRRSPDYRATVANELISDGE